MMKAVAVLPGKANSVHLRQIPVPKLTAKALDQPARRPVVRLRFVATAE